MSEKGFSPNFLETPQQDLQDWLSHEALPDDDLQHALDRSCTPHCVEAIAELHGTHIPSLDRIDEYVLFLREHGAHPENGSNNDKLYSVDDGWYNVAVADLLRFNGYEVILQNLSYNAENSDENAAQDTGRIRSDAETRDLQRLSAYGGEKNTGWLESVKDTLDRGGYALVSIVIPSSKKAGAFGRHTVVVTEVGSSGIEYFDPDKLALERYGSEAGNQQIARHDTKRLIYVQAAANFLERMSGEVMHIFPPKLDTEP